MAAKMNLGEDVVKSPEISDKSSAPKARKALSMEEGFRKMFFEPGLKQLSEQMDESLKEIEEYNKELDREREEKWKKRIREIRNLPREIEASGQKIEDIVKKLQDLILFGDGTSKKEVVAQPSELEDAAHIAMLGQTLAAYMATLDPPHLKKLSTRIVSDVTLWLSRIFRFDDSSAFYHADDRDGLVRVCRLALSSKYEKYGTEGFNSLYTKPPVIYISAASRTGLGQYLCTQLGLPLSSLCTVPCNTVFGSTHTMDIASLERLIKDDDATSKTPLLVVANAGTPMAGHTDNLSRLRSISDEYGVWLHVEGHNLSTLALDSVPTSILAAKKVNSMTLEPGVWLGLPGTPAVTLYKTSDPSMSLAAELCLSQVHERLCTLPLWLALQYIGQEGIVNTLKNAAELSQMMQQKLNQFGPINLAERPKTKDNEIKLEGTVLDIVKNVIAVLVSKTNRKLGETMNRLVPKVYIEVVCGEVEGVCLRFSPMQSAPYHKTNADDINEFVECLQKQIEILNFTLKEKDSFKKCVEAEELLLFVDLPSQAGLGAVQYIPSYISGQLHDNKEQADKELTKINRDLLERLQADGKGVTYSEGVNPENETACLVVGMASDGTSIGDIVQLVANTGKELEDSSKFLEVMKEMIQKKIEEAQEELRKENEQRLIEEGVLRQVPLVGSFVNWWSPLPKEPSMRGRSLNLQSGTLASTESTYKYHMQVQEGSPLPSPSPSPSTKSETSGLASPSLTPNVTPQKPVQKKDLEEVAEPSKVEDVGDDATVEGSPLSPDQDPLSLNQDQKSGTSDSTTASSFQELDTKELETDDAADLK
ncbi:putative pyridoxal-dependent decarboxylase domain-containing protein 2 [Anneissia japonica]|uniref:putative pyridoxal-dependent decarboxylase domain-containing protein 2 n=1 Tax=Anneissia japonica TaxID=1529436 RepID=UPI0014256B43|nr:putative pyridoxal-dependent decarboxylase domain-containing protein 2 [Anneissia japonica]